MAGEAYSKRYGAGGFVDLPAQTTSIDSQFLNGVEAALARLLGADPTDAAVQVWDAGLGRFKTIKLTAANLDPAAGIAKTQLAPLAITDADIAAGANIAGTKLGSNIPASKLANYPSDVTKLLRGDGTWDKPPGTIMGFAIGQAVSTAGGSFAAGQNLLAANISFLADGVSRYIVQALGGYWTTTSGVQTTMIASAALDGAAGSSWTAYTEGAGVQVPFAGAIDLGIPAAATHTVNIRIYAGTGTTSVGAGVPCYVVKVT